MLVWYSSQVKGIVVAMADPGDIELTHVSIEPNNCPLERPLHLELSFRTSRTLDDAYWVIKVRP